VLGHAHRSATAIANAATMDRITHLLYVVVPLSSLNRESNARNIGSAFSVFE